MNYKIMFFLFSIFLSTNASGNEKVLKAALDLKLLVANMQLEKLKAFPCYPKPQCFDEHDMEYIYKSKNQGLIKLLRDPALETKISAFWENSDEKSGAIFYIVTYYLPSSVVNTDKTKQENDLLNEWNKLFTMTSFVVIGEKVYANRTFFYSGAHLPFVGDYG